MATIYTVKTFQLAVAKAYIAFLRQRYGQSVNPAVLTREEKVGCANEVAALLDSRLGTGRDAIYHFLITAIDLTDARK